MDKNGDPWFLAADVCATLGIANSRDALAGLDEDEKDVVTADTLGGPQAMSIISESGLYSLVLRSRKPEAKRFKKWGSPRDSTANFRGPFRYQFGP
jgi:prophage antirepressor-like protein